ncbi:MAG TPA: radical SAM protein, partial [Polyangia bacterium]|nr:radical SAM protein [Polyangia bacterium]
ASITLARVLRRRGYRGRIVCGGHFATLNAADILNEVPEVDVVVRLAGEEALVGLARGARTQDQLAALPGVVFRGDDGAVRFGTPARAVGPVPGDDGHGDPLPVHLGFGAVDLVGSTGCEASCSYCCVAATTRLAGAEAARGGAGADSKSGVVRWTSDRLASEIAAHYHTRAARVFTVMDDNLLPMAADDAEAFLRRLADELRRQGVGKIALSLQLRADVVTPAVADALVAVGLARAYVGIDGYSRAQLVRLGRNAPADAGARAIALLTERGVFAMCNALLVGPTIPLESIRAELEGMRAIRGAPLHLLPIDVRAGTTYHTRAERRGLLEGGFLWRRYRFEDPRTAVLAEVITGLPSRLEEHSVPLALYDLAYNLGIARRLLPALPLAREAETYTRVSDAWNADQLRILEAALAIAADGDLAAARRFAAAEEPRVRRFDQSLMDDAIESLRAVEAAVRASGRRHARAHLRGQLLSAVAFSMALAGCSRPLERNPDGGDARVVVDAPITPLDAPVMPRDAPVFIDAPVIIDVAGTEWHWTAPEVPISDAACQINPTDAGVGFDINRCLPGCGNVRVLAHFDSEGRLVAIDGVDGGTIAQDVVDCLIGSFSTYCYPNLAGTTQTLSSHCWVA